MIVSWMKTEEQTAEMAVEKAAAAFLVAVAAIMMNSTPASAHKLLLSYWFSDGEVVGEIGLSNGTFARDALIQVSGAKGEAIADVRSDENGLFRYLPQEPKEHRFFADLGSGHIAKFTVSAEEIEAGRSGALLGGTGLAANAGQALPAEVMRARVPMPNSGIAATDQNAIKGLIRQELTPLRREIIALREKSGLQSILGGIGYIVGLFGLAFFWMGRQAAKAQRPKPEPQTPAREWPAADRQASDVPKLDWKQRLRDVGARLGLGGSATPLGAGDSSVVTANHKQTEGET